MIAKPISEMDVIAAMDTRGGSFIRALAVAYRHADPVNRGKIKMVWADDWQRYEAMAAMARNHDEVYRE